MTRCECGHCMGDVEHEPDCTHHDPMDGRCSCGSTARKLVEETEKLKLLFPGHWAFGK